MTDLSDFITRIKNHWLDTNNLILSDTVITEAILLSVEEISLNTGDTETLEGLISATETTITGNKLTCLLKGTDVHCLDISLRSGLNTQTSSLSLSNARLHLKTLRTAYDKCLNLLRVDILQNSTDHPHSEWDWDEPSDWASDGET